MHWLWSARSKDESCLGTTVDGSEMLRQWIGSLSHDLQGFIHPWWCRISSINSRKPWWKILTYLSYQLLRISPFNSQILLCPGGGKILLARCWWRKGENPCGRFPKWKGLCLCHCIEFNFEDFIIVLQSVQRVWQDIYTGTMQTCKHGYIWYVYMYSIHMYTYCTGKTHYLMFHYTIGNTSSLLQFQQTQNSIRTPQVPQNTKTYGSGFLKHKQVVVCSWGLELYKNFLPPIKVMATSEPPCPTI